MGGLDSKGRVKMLLGEEKPVEEPAEPIVGSNCAC